MRSAPRNARRRPRVERLEDRLALATLPTGFTQAVVASGLTDPTAMEHAPDGRLWVLEQDGAVEVFHEGSAAGSTALQIAPASIDTRGERGLLGIAFDPSYDIHSAAPDYVYLYYTSTSAPASHNRVSRFVVDNTNPDRPTLSGETVLVNLEQLSATATNHNGGAIHFGPDGKLYVAVGENGTGSNAQSLANRLGKILRYNADGSIPDDNPSRFPGIAGTTSGANRAIWAVGLRNPYTFVFQPETGRMHINDVGASLFEEVNVGRAGANYGWPMTEGKFDQADFPNFTEPLYAYSHGSGTFQGFAITGGAFYDPTAPESGRFPLSFDGDYFFADFVNRWIDVLDAKTGAVTQFASDVPNPVDLRVTRDGGLEYLARGDGTVVKITSTADVPATSRPPANYDGGDTTNLAVYLTALGALAYRPNAAFGTPQPDVIVPFGIPGAGQTIPVQGDYDGDGRADVAAYLPSFGVYAYRPSAGGSDILTAFGAAGAGQSVPTPGDFDGDGKTDLAVYLPAFGSFGIRPSTGGADRIEPFGFVGEGQTLPAPGDYFGTGRDTIAAYLPSLGVFAVRPPDGGPDVIVPFGIAGSGQSIPIPGDYDGDDKTDLAVYFPAFGIFAYRPTSGGPDVLAAFGRAAAGVTPVPGDYTGSGKTEIAVFDAALGAFAYRPADGGADRIVAFGSPGLGASIPAAASPGTLPTAGTSTSQGFSKAATPAASTSSVVARAIKGPRQGTNPRGLTFAARKANRPNDGVRAREPSPSNLGA